MKAFEIQEFGLERLAFVDREMPRPGAKEVLVQMKAASLNYRDYMVVKGTYNPKMTRPMVPLSDGAGVVDEVGNEVTRFKKGDRVAACFMQKWIEGPPTPEKAASALGGAIDGVLREFAVFSEEGLMAIPADVSDEEAASLPCAAVTAWHALFENSPMSPGETVLIQGTGGVSTFALQFAKAAGLRAIITSSSDKKLERARQLGADEIVNYQRTPKWEEEARRLTEGKGVEHVIDVGGSDTFAQSIRAVRTYGVISLVGVLSGREITAELSSVLTKSIRLQGIYVGSRTMFERMNRAIAFHKIKPVIDKTFAWTEIVGALRHMEQQQHIGKICLHF